MTSLPDINNALRKIIGLRTHNLYVGHCGYNFDFGKIKIDDRGRCRGEYSILILCPSQIAVEGKTYFFNHSYDDYANKACELLKDKIVEDVEFHANKHALFLFLTEGTQLMATPRVQDIDYPETWNFYDRTDKLNTTGFVVYPSTISPVITVAKK